MATVLFQRGAAEKLPTDKNVDSFYFATDTKQFWCGDSEMIKEPSLEGGDGYILSTNGSGNRYWADVQELNNLYPYPQNKQTAPLYTNVTELGLTPSVVFGDGVDIEASDKSARRIPAFIVGNDSTYFAACEARTSLSDGSQIEILFAKKSPEEKDWSYKTLFAYDADSKYKYMNPSFVIDRDGIEKEGRIYLFCMKFQITDSNRGEWINLAGTEVNNVYKYSDDNGDTWSEETVMDSWGNSWKFATISCTNSIIMSNGTLVCPIMGYNSSSKSHSGLVYRKKGETTWKYASPSPSEGENECTIYENKGTLYVNTRNTSTKRCVYTYDFESDSYTLVDTSFVPNNPCCADIEELTINNLHLYTMSFIDTETNERANPTVWVSVDGIIFARAIKLYDGTVGSNAGYCVTSSYNSYLASLYERDGKIYFVDLTEKRNVILNTASFLSMSQQYKTKITRSDRYSALSYLYGNILKGFGNVDYVSLLDKATYSELNKHMNVTNGNVENKGYWRFLYLDVTNYRGKTLVVSLTPASKASGIAITREGYSESGNSFVFTSAGTGTGWEITPITIVVPNNAVTLYVDFIYAGGHEFEPYVNLVRNY